MANILEFELLDSSLYAEMSDGALFNEVEWLETWLTILEHEFVAPFSALMELNGVGERVTLSKRSKAYYVAGFYVRRSVRANLRVADMELQRRIVELAQQITTA